MFLFPLSEGRGVGGEGWLYLGINYFSLHRLKYSPALPLTLPSPRWGEGLKESAL